GLAKSAKTGRLPASSSYHLLNLVSFWLTKTCLLGVRCFLRLLCTFLGPCAAYRFDGSRPHVNIYIVNITHHVFVVTERRHDLVLATREILLPADDNADKLGIVDAFHRILEGGRISGALTIRTMANMAFRMIAAKTRVSIPVHRPIRLNIKSRSSFCVDILAFFLLDCFGITWRIGDGRGSE